MNLLIYENLNESQLNELNELFNKKEYKIESIFDFNAKTLKNFERVVCLANEVHTFLSTDFQIFLLENAGQKTFELAVLKDKVDDTGIIQNWITAASVKDNLNVKFITSINYENFSEGLKTFANLIQRKLRKAEKVIIYTDGACSFNPGPGGWAAYIRYGSRTKKLSGFEPETTNNRMEILSVIKGLSALNRPCRVELYSDSAYVVNGMRYEWITNWKANKWKNSDDKPVKNQDLWKELDKLVSIHEVEFFKVKGHSDDEYNNLVDKMATNEIAKNLKKLEKAKKVEEK